MKLRSISLVAATVAGLVFAGAAAADNTIYRQIDAERVSVTKFEGKPPFQRRVVNIKDLSAAEFARFEEQKGEPEVDRSQVGKKVRIIDRSGKPPFNQRVVTVTEENAAEFARFEEQAEQPAKFKGPSARGWPAR